MLRIGSSGAIGLNCTAKENEHEAQEVHHSDDRAGYRDRVQVYGPARTLLGEATQYTDRDDDESALVLEVRSSRFEEGW
jgi:hypothetical protein